MVPAVALSSDGGATFQKYLMPASEGNQFGDTLSATLRGNQLLLVYKVPLFVPGTLAGEVRLVSFDLTTKTFGAPAAVIPSSKEGYEARCPQIASTSAGLLLTYLFPVSMSVNNVFLASNDGTHWTKATTPGNGLFTGLVAVGDAIVYEGALGPPQRTTDLGKTWTPIGPSGRVLTKLMVDGPRLWAISEPGTAFPDSVYSTDDTGATWTSHPVGQPSTVGLQLISARGREVILYWLDGFGVRAAVSNDGGATFTF